MPLRTGIRQTIEGNPRSANSKKSAEIEAKMTNSGMRIHQTIEADPHSAK
ncbi:hypothetical protein [Virgibacillus sp. JSM 102003]